ncbi:hypothetical protein PDE_01472 [Penicillium oxalicum 114-2]|uniref:Uncharacterized protein n=1 Tax=Penicillium oxalicum (strain 114-2 / CGMCC 5302) TaxID=933388 RepID=S7Z7I5_PENO1|nr:hypothetical protein PDE_01472 [Penicillium oxalicum 114-2]
MADNSSPDYKSLFLQEEERRKHAEDEGRREKERRELAESRRNQIEERTRRTTFPEFILIDLQVYKARKQSRGEITRIGKSKEKEEERENL